MSFEHASFLVALAATAVACWTDVRTGHIPNWLTLGALGTGFALAAARALVRHQGPGGAAAAVAVAAVGGGLCGFVPFVLWRSGGLGGGDIKLFAALGALCGPKWGAYAETYAFAAGPVYALGLLVAQGRLAPVMRNVRTMVSNALRSKERRRPIRREQMTPVRFAPAIFAGTFLVALLQWRSR
jgi:prepilin peptidase CpaA